MLTITMIVRRQTIERVAYPRLVNGTIAYYNLDCRFSPDWDGLSKNVIFESDGKEPITLLLTDDKYTSEQGFTLGAGLWHVKLVGFTTVGGEVETRITANGGDIRVNSFGVIDEPMNPTYGEQIAAIAIDAKAAAVAAQEAAEGSQDSAAASAQSAASSASDALTAAKSAVESADNAANSAQSAAQSAANARASELAAIAAANEAGEYRDTVKADADRASTAAKSAETSASNATTSAYVASTAKNDATDAARRAEASARSAAISQSQMIYPSFGIDSDGYLIVHNPETLGATDFSVNYDTGNLEVRI